MVHYLALAEQGERELRGPRQAAWLERLSQEHDTLLAALRWSAARGDGETALRLGGALAWFWKRKGLLIEGREALTLVLASTARSESAGSAAWRAKALYGAGELASLQGDRVTAHRLLGESVALWRGLDDKAGLAYALVARGAIMRDASQERSLYEEALALSQDVDDEWGIAHALMHLAAAARDRHDYAEARSLGEEAFTRLRRVGDQWQIAFGLLHAGIAALAQGDDAVASGLVEQSAALWRELDAKQGLAWSLDKLGQIAIRRGDVRTAAASFEESLALKRQFGQRSGMAIALSFLGQLACERGDNTGAAARYTECLRLRYELDDWPGIGEPLEGLAIAAAGHGAWERALRLAGAASTARRAAARRTAPALRARLARVVVGARHTLGYRAAAAAWAAGRALNPEQAVRYALGDALDGC